jgi:sugar phosphate permease
MLKELNMTYAQYGNGTFLMLAFYGPMQAVVGFITDKFGAKRVLLFSIVAWSLATWWMAHIQTVELWYFRQIVFGILCATEFVPSSRILVRWFAKRQRAQAQSALSYAWILTPSFAPILVTMLVTAFGSWRPIFTIAALIGIIPFVIILAWIYDRPEHKKGLSGDEICESYEDEIASGVYTKEEVATGNISEEKIAAQRIPFSKLMAHPGWLKICIAYIVIQALAWAAMSWIPLYLKETFGFSLNTMGFWACTYFAGGVIGSFCGSLFSDKLFKGKRKPVILVSYLGVIPFLLIFAFAQKGVSPIALLLTLSACGFFANCSWGAWFAWPAEIFSAEVHAKALGIINAFGYFIGAAGAPLVMSRLVIKTDTGASYTWAWLFIAALAIVGSILVATTKELKSMAQTEAEAKVANA